jgi:hypothetical protein
MQITGEWGRYGGGLSQGIRNLLFIIKCKGWLDYDVCLFLVPLVAEFSYKRVETRETGALKCIPYN